MSAKLVLKGGCDWDTLFGPVHTAHHTSTGESPFYLVYDHDVRIPSSVVFIPPVAKCNILQIEYGSSSFNDLYTECKKHNTVEHW